MTNQSHRKVQINGDLHINSVQRNDSGRYTCSRARSDQLNHHFEILKSIHLKIICKYSK